MEDFRVKYIRSLSNVAGQFGYNGMDDLDLKHLHMLQGVLYEQIRMDGKMTKELAVELDLEHLWTEA